MKVMILSVLFLTVSPLFALIGGCETPENFDCSLLHSEAEQFYVTKGEWAGIYTMKVQESKMTAKGICHMKYFYTPVPGQNLTTGYDFREFRFKPDEKCRWKAFFMGPYMSGKNSFP
ncbi:MAG TPA: hypothetical protein PL048_13715 [Leptospiraceae bacterium]|nr:hypothetical protein [Leptospiraceae bacterium]HMZ59831.1 hypothetical protein [Leptospiraceae bacterium]HNF25576.1 hypothetical protein [Leptospiraceae bacterium]HNI28283.1 hypothetical protein [Leptospiraceae bacterium]HNI99415.1 hypothetical protein [Leptospiraceae bacterium]